MGNGCVRLDTLSFKKLFVHQWLEHKMILYWPVLLPWIKCFNLVCGNGLHASLSYVVHSSCVTCKVCMHHKCCGNSQWQNARRFGHKTLIGSGEPWIHFPSLESNVKWHFLMTLNDDNIFAIVPVDATPSMILGATSWLHSCCHCSIDLQLQRHLCLSCNSECVQAGFVVQRWQWPMSPLGSFVVVTPAALQDSCNIWEPTDICWHVATCLSQCYSTWSISWSLGIWHVPS